MPHPITPDCRVFRQSSGWDGVQRKNKVRFALLPPHRSGPYAAHSPAQLGAWRVTVCEQHPPDTCQHNTRVPSVHIPQGTDPMSFRLRPTRANLRGYERPRCLRKPSPPTECAEVTRGPGTDQGLTTQRLRLLLLRPQPGRRPPGRRCSTPGHRGRLAPGAILQRTRTCRPGVDRSGDVSHRCWRVQHRVGTRTAPVHSARTG
jgi:hypothetical protein